jgi:hypothetical protein
VSTRQRGEVKRRSKGEKERGEVKGEEIVGRVKHTFVKQSRVPE